MVQDSELLLIDDLAIHKYHCCRKNEKGHWQHDHHNVKC